MGGTYEEVLGGPQRRMQVSCQIYAQNLMLQTIFGINCPICMNNATAKEKQKTIQHRQIIFKM
jgi:hypothetical protein